MELNITYRGKTITGNDIRFIRELISANPADTRRSLSKKLCEAWNWVQPNGALRDMVCRGLMLQLHRSGYITLPPKKVNPNNPFVTRCTPSPASIDTAPIHTTVAGIGHVQFKQVRRTDAEELFNSLIHEYHYLGYTHPVVSN